MATEDSSRRSKAAGSAAFPSAESAVARRRWAHFWYCDAETDAHIAADRMREAGWHIDRIDRTVEGTGWAIVAENYVAEVTPDCADTAQRFFSDLARMFRGGEYDGDELAHPRDVMKAMA